MDVLCIEVADNGQLAVGRAVEITMELHQLIYSDGAKIGNFFVKGRNVTHIALRIGIHVPLIRLRGDRAGFAFLRLDAGDLLLAQRFEFRRWKRRLPEHLCRQHQDLGQILVDGLDGGCNSGCAAADGESRLEPVQLVLNILPCVPCRSSYQHLGRQPADRGLSHQRFLVAELQPQDCGNRITSRFFWNQRQLQPTRQGDALSTRIDILGRWIESFADRYASITLVILHPGDRVRRRRNFGSVRFGRGYEETDGSIRRLEIVTGGALHIIPGDLLQAVPMDEEQTPVSHCSPFAKPQTDVAGVVQKEIDIFEKSCARSLRFFGRNRVGTHAVNSGKHDVARFLE